MRPLIAEARRLADAATPGPWGSYDGDRWIGTKIVGRGKASGVVAKVYHNREKTEDDAAFIAAARTLVPQLCDALEEAAARPAEVTDEMVERAVRTWREEYSQEYPGSGNWPAMRAALAAALAVGAE